MDKSSRKKMSWSFRKMGCEKLREQIPESRGEMEARKKTEIAMGIADSERSKRKLRGIKQAMEEDILVNSPLMTVMPRN